MSRCRAVSCLVLSFALAGAACNNDEGGQASPREGSGGAAKGGSGGGGNGGSSAVAGAGGKSSAGGSSGSGGSIGNGGSAAGGASSTGGTVAAGGNSGSGGTSASGGTTSRGGSGGNAGNGGSASGGSSAKGGTTAAGGSGVGGTTAKGGAGGSGGVVGSGGAAGGAGGTTTPSTAAKFSFFVVSYAALQKIAGNTKGLGGDLRHGLTGAGAGLRGADKICSEVAEGAMAGAGSKTWHAFLSATADENGKQVNAIDRIGKGPWYDRLGRLFANDVSELYYDRPKNADAAIKNDFPNENGVTNQNPDKTGNVDNHDMLTGSDDEGKLYSSTATCSDWTSTATTGSKPRVGHSWPTSANMCSTASTLGGAGGASGAGGSGGGFPGGGGPGMGSMCNWMSALDESGCAPGVNLIQNGGPGNDGTVGSGGGYGGWYCFALTP